MNRLLGIAEAALVAGVQPVTMSTLASARHIPFFQFCGKRRFSRNLLEYYREVRKRPDVTSLARVRRSRRLTQLIREYMQHHRNQNIELSFQPSSYSRVPRTIEKLLGPDDVARILGVSRLSIYRLVSARKITFHKISGKLRFRTQDIERFLDTHRVNVIE